MGSKYWSELKLHCGDPNSPELYTNPDFENRDALILEQLEKLGLPKTAKILDLGCGCGRTLNVLHRAGYTKLSGIDINRYGFMLTKIKYPKLYNICNMTIGTFGKVLAERKESYDAVISVSTLLHVTEKEQKIIYNWLGTHTKFAIFLEHTSCKLANVNGKLLAPVTASIHMPIHNFKCIVSKNAPTLSKNHKIYVYKKYSNAKTVVQILFPISGNQRFLFSRTLLLPTNMDNFFYIMPSICKPVIESSPVHSQIKNSIIYVESNINGVMAAIKELNPKSIILTVSPSNTTINKFGEYKNKIYYIQHGIIYDFAVVPPRVDKSWHKEINYIMPDPTSKAVVTRGNINAKQINVVYGLPQFDYVMRNRVNYTRLRQEFVKAHKLPPKKKIVLVVNGSWRDRNRTDIIDSIVHTLDTVAIDYFLIVKCKSARMGYITGKRNILFLDHTSKIYDYFFSDLLIVVEGGTSLVECIFDNPLKTIFYKCDKKEYKALSMPNIVMNNESQLVLAARSRLGGKMSSTQKATVQSEANEFIKRVIGRKITPVSDRVLALVRK